jgi:hypothetical protein
MEIVLAMTSIPGRPALQFGRLADAQRERFHQSPAMDQLTIRQLNRLLLSPQVQQDKDAFFRSHLELLLQNKVDGLTEAVAPSTEVPLTPDEIHAQALTEALDIIYLDGPQPPTDMIFGASPTLSTPTGEKKNPLLRELLGTVVKMYADRRYTPPEELFNSLMSRIESLLPHPPKETEATPGMNQGITFLEADPLPLAEEITDVTPPVAAGSNPLTGQDITFLDELSRGPLTDGGIVFDELVIDPKNKPPGRE